MKKFILILVVLFSGLLTCYTNVNANPEPQQVTQEDLDKGVEVTGKRKCKGIKLNTNMPFIGNCIQTYDSHADENGDRVVTPVNAFPTLIGALMNLLMTIILIMSLLMIVWSGVLMTMGGMDSSRYTSGIKLLTRVVQGMALLGASGVILKVINPNFFV